MTTLDIKYFEELEQKKQQEIEEVNTQIRALTQRQQNYTDTATYIQEVKTELSKFFQEISDESEQLNLKIQAHNEAQGELAQLKNAINYKLGESAFKLKFKRLMIK